MTEKINSFANIQSMLQTLRTHQAEASGGLQPPVMDSATEAPKTDFGTLVRNALGEVNAMQLQSRALQTAYDSGQPVPLTEVVLGMQKSSLAFEATLQMRNKVLKAYEEIINMPV
jgi:flagellar hook-basal body complex protein FliE